MTNMFYHGDNLDMSREHARDAIVALVDQLAAMRGPAMTTSADCAVVSTVGSAIE